MPGATRPNAMSSYHMESELQAYLANSLANECINVHLVVCLHTDMQEKTKARLCELASAARGSQEAGFTQPSFHLFLNICTSSPNKTFQLKSKIFHSIKRGV